VTSIATAISASRLAPPARCAERPLRILFLVSADNSLSQRVFVALTDLGSSVNMIDRTYGHLATDSEERSGLAWTRARLVLALI
jgi:hypothetical protein